MSVAEPKLVEDHQPGAGFAPERPATPWHVATDPFAGASPVCDLSALIGGLPDARDAKEILSDLAHCRKRHARR